MKIYIKDWCFFQDEMMYHGIDNSYKLAYDIILAGKRIRNLDIQAKSLLCCFEVMKRKNNFDQFSSIINCTSFGSFDSVTKLLVESYQNSRPYQISPGNIPNTVINSSAGIAAIEYNIQGPNISISADELSFYSSLIKVKSIFLNSQSDEIFLSAIENWDNSYGEELLLEFGVKSRENLPFSKVYANLFLLSKASSSVSIIFTKMGRIFNLSNIDSVIMEIINYLKIDKNKIIYSNIWSYNPISSPIFNDINNASILPRKYGYLMAALGSYQCNDIIQHLVPSTYGMQLTIDKDGFYGICILYKD